MRLAPLAVATACVLLAAGCAPESMATHAVPAQHSAPSIITPTLDAASAREESAEASGQQAKMSAQNQLQPAASASAEQLPAEPAEATEPAEQTPSETASSPADEVSPAAAAEETTAAASTTASETPTAPVAKPSESAQATPAAPSRAQWRDVNMDDVAFSDAKQLEAVSPSFRDYAEQAMSAADTDGCTVLGLGVMSVHPAGYVVGSVSTDCGGGQAIWVENAERSSWKVAMVLQAPPQCAELMSIGLPAGVGLLCDEGSGTLREY